MLNPSRRYLAFIQEDYFYKLNELCFMVYWVVLPGIVFLRYEEFELEISNSRPVFLSKLEPSMVSDHYEKKT